MSFLSPFDVLRPDSLAQVLALVAGDPGAKLLAGGTDLVPNLRRGLGQPRLLIDTGGLPALAEIELGSNGLALGARVTLAQLAQHADIARIYPALTQAAAEIAGPGHRTVATVGGNLCQDTRCTYYNQSEWWRAANGYCLKRGGSICHVAPQGERCHAAFSGDLAPALLALGATVDVASVRGTRQLPLAEMYRDDGAAHLTMAADEMLTRITLPAPSAGSVSAYRKARVRGAMDFPLAGVACVLRIEDGQVRELQLAISGTNSNPFVLDGTAALLDRTPDADWLTQLGKLVQKQVSPMRSTVTPANYRRQVASALAQRLVRELASLG